MIHSIYGKLVGTAAPGDLRVHSAVPDTEYVLQVNGDVLSTSNAYGAFGEYSDDFKRKWFTLFDADGALLLNRCDHVCIEAPVPTPSLRHHNLVHECDKTIDLRG